MLLRHFASNYLKARMIHRIIIFALFIFQFFAYCQRDIYSFQSFLNLGINAGINLVDQTYDLFTDVTGVGETCPFRDNMGTVLTEKLYSRIRGQDEAMNAIISAFATWEMDKQLGNHRPLVLAFTGPTGVGKSETAYRIADAILVKKNSFYSYTDRSKPHGLVVFRGEDYSIESELLSQGVYKAQESIRSTLVEQLKRCQGNLVVVFDEVQKIAPKVLEVILPALEDRGSISIMSPTQVMYSTQNVVFILISDIGFDQMKRFLIGYGDREAIPLSRMRNEIKKSMDQQWDRLQLGKTIKGIVPFLPLEQKHIAQILRLKVTLMAIQNRNKSWKDMIIDDEVILMLSGPTYVMYNNHSILVNLNNTTNNNNEEQKITRSKIFATYGARSLDNVGPLQDLKSLIQKYLLPWRPNEILHIGLTFSSNIDKHRKKWGIRSVTGNSKDELLFMQWCQPSTELLNYSAALSHPGYVTAASCFLDNDFENENNEKCSANEAARYEFLNKYYLSESCETKWYGSMLSNPVG